MTDRLLTTRDVATFLGLSRETVTAAYDTSVRNFGFIPWNPFWNAENWWLAE
jgi:DNA-binding transcriptional MocR family regulator